MKDLAIIETFIQQHHIASLATWNQKEIESCSVFYAYDTKTHTFIIASDTKTHHIQNSLKNPQVALTIHLDTKEIGKIEGVQIKATLQKLTNKALKKHYFQTFPYALAMQPTLWEIHPFWMKYTANRLGFGKKLIVTL